ncbi:MAG: KTSC domain-containing protein [Chthoniobacterales bacterium]
MGLLAVVGLGLSDLKAADRTIEPIVSHIPRAAVDSSGLATIGYSKHLHALEIQFRDGLIYRYLEVPVVTYRELVSAESKARFYNQRIRGKYHCLRVRPKRTR